ncbi:hypothetical protein ACA910_001110 [Epithemia clementina (nom. ined.)]
MVQKDDLSSNRQKKKEPTWDHVETSDKEIRSNGGTMRSVSGHKDHEEEANHAISGKAGHVDSKKESFDSAKIASAGEETLSSSTTTATTHSVDLESLIPSIVPASLSTSGLEHRLRQLREASTQHSQILTQKLASSQSGQNLLHMGSALSTLPPDLQNLMAQLQPFLNAVEQAEQDELQRLETLVATASKVQHKSRRIQQAHAAANLYADLQAAELAVEHYRRTRGAGASGSTDGSSKNQTCDIDLIAPLERAAHLTSCLLADLNVANEQVRNMTTAHRSSVTSKDGSNKATSGDASKQQQAKSATSVPTLRSTPLEEDTELAYFLLRLAPRIRRFESNTVTALLHAMEDLLLQLQELRSSSSPSNEISSSSNHLMSEDKKQQPPQSGSISLVSSAPNSANNTTSTNGASTTGGSSSEPGNKEERELDLLIMFGHCMRGLAILGRGSDVESIFARVAIMPLIRSKVSMGRLDQGGSRGECAGLFSLLDEMATVIQQSYGPVLSLGEIMFHVDVADSATNGDSASVALDVDLITAGVWVPIVTALMADSAIKMAIFSPGIASVLQANYVALDTFLSELASRLLRQENETDHVKSIMAEEGNDDVLMFNASFITKERKRRAQERIYAHPKTAEFSKRWNLPIYYQLRFGESCTRLNKAVDQTRREGWIAHVFTGSEARAEELKSKSGFELSLFLELFDVLCDLWRPDVILRPLAKRFLRGAVQLVGRTISFINDSMDGKITFGEEEPPQQQHERSGDGTEQEDGLSSLSAEASSPPTRAPYCWGESEDDVAAVAWELAILESSIRNEYVDRVCEALQEKSDNEETGKSTRTSLEELKSLVSSVLEEASSQIHPVIDKSWNEIIVKLVTAKCSGPLSAVKGVAVMYRMTNRPPPTQPSSFVGTIFRPLNDFSRSFRNRTPEMIGAKWKQQIVVTVSDRYAAAVDELLTTVQRTEVALKNRKARRIAAGGMSDGEKLKLQLYLDYKCFSQSVRDVGVDPATVIGLSKLKELTAEGEALQSRQQTST